MLDDDLFDDDAGDLDDWDEEEEEFRGFLAGDWAVGGAFLKLFGL